MEKFAKWERHTLELCYGSVIFFAGLIAKSDLLLTFGIISGTSLLRHIQANQFLTDNPLQYLILFGLFVNLLLWCLLCLSVFYIQQYFCS